MKVIREMLQNNKVLCLLWIMVSMFGYYFSYKENMIGVISSAILMLIIALYAGNKQ